MVESGSVVTAETLAELVAEIKDIVRRAVVSAIREADAHRWALPAHRASPPPLH